MKKIVFMGSDPIAIPLLNYLRNEKKENVTLIGVFSQPDRPTGRGHKLQPNLISEWALAEDIQLLRPEQLTPVEYDWLKSNAVDLVLVMAYGHIIRSDFLNLPPLGMFNFHASLLPKYRGASPIETAIACGETKTGITLMKMVTKMDAGPIVDQEVVDILPNDMRQAVRQKMSEACVPLLKRNLGSILEGNPPLIEQDPFQVSYTRKLNKEDGWIDFQLPAKEIVNRYRAFELWPGTFFGYQGTILKVNEVSWSHTLRSTTPIGQVVEINAQMMKVQMGEGVLQIGQLQKPGGRMLRVADFIQGFPLKTGIILEGHVGQALTNNMSFPKPST